ncbi:DUF6382 domain-containing protein [Paenibacillus sp. FSL R7-0331]|uniref:DUF6382 domain-containing protein n=1 Tax=Paenibacillus sp. FSL R7-0331 TaxID=1536773 RepID=UPI0018CCA5D2|nr:DUF6382 domain-containing protein [Paenibacillus sp. FSL R7-0331]
MFGLTRDFIQQDGISMQLGSAKGLTAAELNMVQARMLMNTVIPHHLRLLLKEIDLKITLEYAVSRRKMLSHLLKSERLSMGELFGLLLQIARGMEEGRLYMLRAEQYALHADYIFIEGPLGSGKVFLTYIPLQPAEPLVSTGEAVKSLVMVLMASVTELSGSGLQRLLQYCGSMEFSPAGLKSLLAELLADDGLVDRLSAGTEAASSNMPAGTGHAVSGELPVRRMQEQQSGVPQAVMPGEASAPSALRRHSLTRPQEQAAGSSQGKEQAWGGPLPRLRLTDESELSEYEDVDEADNVILSPYRTYAALGAVLADALLWKFLYLDKPSTLWLSVCLAATAILAFICWMVWSGRIMTGVRLGGDGRGERLEGEALEAEERSINRRPKGSEWDFGKNPVTPFRAQTPPVVEQKRPLQVRKESGSLLFENKAPARPQPAPEPATALLEVREGEAAGRGKVQAGRTGPFLERTGTDEDGAAEKIELDRASFIIGRSADVAQYVEKSEGASRVHAEISRGPAGYIIKDLDSRNGTLYQGAPMIPYKEYPLTEGSEFTIIKGSYTFRSA